MSAGNLRSDDEDRDPTSSMTYTELTDFLMSLHKPVVAVAS
jgi:hypothetical protein